MFEDRLDAARQLLAPLAALCGPHPLLLAIPRGAVPIAAYLARALDGDLDVVLTRKIAAPYDAEFAIGALAEDGTLLVMPWATQAGADAAYLEAARQREAGVIAQRRAALAPLLPAKSPAGRTVVVVDDGMATGATMQVALDAARAAGAATLIAAVPVASCEACERVRHHCDTLLCLQMPPAFGAVGAYYRHFDQVSDAAMLQQLAAAPGSDAAAADYDTS